MQEEVSPKEAAKQIYADMMPEPIWWPEEILDSLEVSSIGDGFALTSSQAKGLVLQVSMSQENYFFKVVEPSDDTLGLVNSTSGMAHNQEKARRIYESLKKISG